MLASALLVVAMTPAPAAAQANPAVVQFVAVDGARLSVSVAVTDTAGEPARPARFVRLCMTTPCTVRGPLGTHRFALARPRERPVVVEHPIQLRGDARIAVALHSDATRRTFAFLLGGFTLFSGAITMAAGLSLCPSEPNDTCERDSVVIGLLGWVIGMAAAAVLWSDDDAIAAVIGRPDG